MKTIALSLAIIATTGLLYSFTIISKTEVVACKNVEDSRNGNLAGHTYQSPDKATLDFYSDGTVVYHADGANVSRRGTYTVSQPKNTIGPIRNLTVKIWVGENVTTLEGSFNITGNTITLNRRTWKMMF